MRLDRWLFAILLTITPALGKVGPKYVEPDTESPAGWNATDSSLVDPAATPLREWWNVFGDPMLSDLIQRAAERNHDVRIAQARLRESRAAGRVARAGLLPNVGAGASASVTRLSENSVGQGSLARAGLVPVQSDSYQTGFDASWEIDIFGGKRRQVEAAKSRVQAAEEVRRDVLVTLLAEVARNYTELRGAQQRLEVAEKNVRIQSDTLELVENKFTAGLVREIDVAQASAQLGQTRAILPEFEAAIYASAHRLAVLVGEAPTSLLTELLESKPLPPRPGLVPVGVPSELLRRRPDIRRAERELAAATADIGVAVADLYPRFFLSGGAGFEGGAVNKLFQAASGTWLFGPRIHLPIFQGGRIRARIKASKARTEQALTLYEQKVLLALEEVETSLVRYRQKIEAYNRLVESQQASRRAVELSRTLYDLGLTDFLGVLDPERVLTDVDDRVARSETQVLMLVISLFKALGGGWEEFPEP